MLKITLPASILLLLALISSVTQAQEADADATARVHFEAGNSYYETGDYELALREFQRAYDLSKRAELQYNISLTHEKLGDIDEAVAALSRYLDEGKAIPNRTTLEIRLENLKKRLEEQKQQEGQAQTAAAAIAEPAAESTGDPEPPPDQATAEEDKTAAEQAAGETDEKRSARDRQEQAAEQSSDRAEADGSGSALLKPGPLAAFITAGVGAVTFGVFATMAAVEDGSLSDQCVDASGRATCSSDDVSALQTYALVADIGLGVALVAGAVGVVLLLTSGDEGQGEQAAIAPWIGPQQTGVVTRVRF